MTTIGYERRIGERRRIPPIEAVWTDDAVTDAEGHPVSVACRLVDVWVSGAAVHLPMSTPLRLGTVVTIAYAGGRTTAKVCRAEVATTANEIRVGLEYVRIHPLLARARGDAHPVARSSGRGGLAAPRPLSGSGAPSDSGHPAPPS